MRIMYYIIYVFETNVCTQNYRNEKKIMEWINSKLDALFSIMVYINMLKKYILNNRK